MPSYPAAIPLSNRTLVRLADLIRAHRVERRSRWRRLTAGRQALLVLAYPRNRDTYARLAAGFAIGTTTAWRHVRECHRRRPRPSRGQKDVNRSHARIQGERAVAVLKAWKILTKLRCCPHRATAIVQAILVLNAIEAGPYSR